MAKIKNKKKFMIGAYSVGLTAVVVAIVIAVNLLAAQLPATFAKLDTSFDGIITLTDDTKSVLDGLDTKTTIYHVYTDDYKDNEYIVATINVLKRYEDASSKITVKTIDPVARPTFTSQYTDATLSENSIIVVSEKRSTCIDGNDLLMYLVSLDGTTEEYYTMAEYEYLNQMYESYYGMSVPATVCFFAENEITRAIDYVSHDTLPVVYALTGHNETPLTSTAFGSLMADENIELKDLALATGDKIAIPEDATALLVNIPLVDISEAESDAIIKYLNGGGQVILNTYVTNCTEKNMPNLAKVCAHMGLKAVDSLVFEGSTTGYSQVPYNIIPQTTGKGITSGLDTSALYIYMNQSHAITTVEKENVYTAPLLNTTKEAYLYTEEMANDPENEDLIKNAEKAEFSLAYQSTLTDEEDNAKGSLFWFATPYFMGDTYATAGNGQLFITLLTSICDKPTSVSVIGKEFTQHYLTLTQSTSLLWSFVTVIAIPAAALIAGFVVWFIRRSK